MLAHPQVVLAVLCLHPVVAGVTVASVHEREGDAALVDDRRRSASDVHVADALLLLLITALRRVVHYQASDVRLLDDVPQRAHDNVHGARIAFVDAVHVNKRIADEQPHVGIGEYANELIDNRLVGLGAVASHRHDQS
jgi:hypothetical protein